MSSGEPLTKVTFELEPGLWHGSATEALWAAAVGQNQYRLENSPFFAFGVSFQDVVLAGPRDGGICFDSVISRGGHSTYRIIPTGRVAELQTAWEDLRKLGCTYEEGPMGLLAIDVPPGLNLYDVYALLEEGEDAGIWSFEEGHCGHATT